MAIRSARLLPTAGRMGCQAAAPPDWQSGDLDNGPEQPSGHELLIDGHARRAGELMRIPTLGATLRGIAAEGKDYIYQRGICPQTERTCAALWRLDYTGRYGDAHEHLG